jgi:hypothetical protein
MVLAVADSHDTLSLHTSADHAPESALDVNRGSNTDTRSVVVVQSEGERTWSCPAARKLAFPFHPGACSIQLVYGDEAHSPSESPPLASTPECVRGYDLWAYMVVRIVGIWCPMILNVT